MRSRLSEADKQKARFVPTTERGGADVLRVTIARCGTSEFQILRKNFEASFLCIAKRRVGTKLEGLEYVIRKIHHRPEQLA